MLALYRSVVDKILLFYDYCTQFLDPNCTYALVAYIGTFRNCAIAFAVAQNTAGLQYIEILATWILRINPVPITAKI